MVRLLLLRLLVACKLLFDKIFDLLPGGMFYVVTVEIDSCTLARFEIFLVMMVVVIAGEVIGLWLWLPLVVGVVVHPPLRLWGGECFAGLRH